MILELLEAPSVEPISLEEALAHLRLGTAEDAVQVQGLLRAAREQVEARTGQEIAPARYRLYLPHWFPEEYTQLPKPPLLSVQEIRFVPQSHKGPVESGSYVGLSSSYWRSEPYGPHGENWLWTAPHPSLPPLFPDKKAVRIDFTSGYEPSRVPGGLRIAILMLLRDLYDQVTEPNAALESLILSHRNSGFAA